MPLSTNLTSQAVDFSSIQNKISALIGLESDKTTMSLIDRLIETYTVTVAYHLTGIFAENSQDDLRVLALKNYLAYNWNLIKRSRLSYTALPESAVTKLLVDLSNLLATSPACGENDPLALLMPNVTRLNTDVYADYLPELPHEDNPNELTAIIKRHVLTEDGRYLIPAFMLTHIANPENPLDKIPNIPFINDESINAEQSSITANYYLTKCEIKLLITHSEESRALHAARNYYDRLKSDNSHLLGNIYELLQNLRINSIDGIGQEEQAGAGGEKALRNFWAYYQCLSNEHKNQIPQAVAEQIRKIRQCLGIYREGEPPIPPIQTCFATRREQLEESIRGHEVTLAAIAVTEHQKSEQISHALTQLQQTHTAFLTALAQEHYNGHEKSNLSMTLLDSLDIEINFTHFQSMLDCLTQLSASELNSLCTRPQVHTQITEQLHSLNELITLSIDLNRNQLEIFFSAMSEHLINNLLNHPTNISKLLSCLPNEKINFIINGLNNYLPQTMIYEDDLELMLQHLTAEQSQIVCNTLQESLPAMIKNKQGFICAFQHLSPELYNQVYSAMQENLDPIIKDSDDLEQVLRCLSSGQCQALCEALQETLPRLIPSCTEFMSVIRNLAPEQCRVVCHAVKGLLLEYPLVLQTLFDPINTYNNQAQLKIIFEAMKEELPTLIQSSEEFNNILRHITPRQREYIFNQSKAHLLGLVESGHDFHLMLEYLTPKQRGFIFNGIKPKLSDLTKSSVDYTYINRYLTKKQSALFFNAMQKRFPELMIYKIEHLNQVLTQLSPKQCKIFCDAMQQETAYLPSTLSSILWSVFDYKKVLEGLTREKREIAIDAMKAHLPGLIESSYDFSHAFCDLPHKHRASVFNALKARLPDIIGSNHNLFHQICPHLTPAQRGVTYEIIRDQLPQYITSYHDFYLILKDSTPRQGKNICFSMRHRLPEIIQSTIVFKYIINGVTPEQSRILCDAIKHFLPKLFESTSHFYRMLRYLSPAHGEIVFEAMLQVAPGLILSCNNFKNALHNFNLEQCTNLCRAIKPHWLKLIVSIRELAAFLTDLPIRKCRIVYESFPKKYLHQNISYQTLLNAIEVLPVAQRAPIKELFMQDDSISFNFQFKCYALLLTSGLSLNALGIALLSDENNTPLLRATAIGGGAIGYGALGLFKEFRAKCQLESYSNLHSEAASTTHSLYL